MTDMCKGVWRHDDRLSEAEIRTAMADEGWEPVEAVSVQSVVEAPLNVAMAEAERQMEKWRTTLDWLADR